MVDVSKLDDGVSAYLKATATAVNFFPVDYKGIADICCEQCRFYRTQSRRCGLTDEITPYPSRYVGRNCPLEITEKENE